jgi:transcriptional regulator with XRE-family HTH domain
LYKAHSHVRLVVVEVKSMSDKKEFKHNNKLKELRKDKGLSQQALAEQIGVHYRTLQNWENGKTNIKPEKAEQLASFFNVPVVHLLGYDDIEDLITDTEDSLKKGVEEQQKAGQQASSHYDYFLETIFDVLDTFKEGTKENKLEQKDSLEMIDTLEYLVTSLDKWNKKLYESQTMLLQYDKLKQKIDYSKQELKNLK